MNGLINQGRPFRRDLFPLAAMGATGVVLFALTFAHAAARVEKVASPHWKPDGCASCHTIDQDKVTHIAPAAVDETCFKCHDGRQASAEFHPVGMQFDHKRFTRPEKWPVVDDRLTCSTCHDMQLACSRTAVRPTSNRMMLRDYQAGRAQSKPFCRNCHQESAYKKINPHAMLLTEKNEIIEDKCLFCHTKPLDRNATARTGNSWLKADQASLCHDCHPQHKDPMKTGHIGLKVPDEMLATLRARETMGLAARIPQQVIKEVQTAGEKPTKMVPGPGGTIVCSTCHNPHQMGVFTTDSVLSYRAMRPNADGKMTSPVRGQTWCKHCHDF